jgi:hypothetical protein
MPRRDCAVDTHWPDAGRVTKSAVGCSATVASAAAHAPGSRPPRAPSQGCPVDAGNAAMHAPDAAIGAGTGMRGAHT